MSSARGEAKRDQMPRAAVALSAMVMRRGREAGLEPIHCTDNSQGLSEWRDYSLVWPAPAGYS